MILYIHTCKRREGVGNYVGYEFGIPTDSFLFIVPDRAQKLNSETHPNKFASFFIGGYMSKVALIMGSKNDWAAVKPAYDVLKEFGISAEARVMSAHRTPAIASEFAAAAKDNGFSVIIAAAGKAAHLAGVIAGHTTLPVIGLPVKSSFMDGLDSLLSVVQMPTGIPVATVAVGGAENAGILAVQILALSDRQLAEKLSDYKRKMIEKIVNDDKKLNEELNAL